MALVFIINVDILPLALSLSPFQALLLLLSVVFFLSPNNFKRLYFRSHSTVLLLYTFCLIPPLPSALPLVKSFLSLSLFSQFQSVYGPADETVLLFQPTQPAKDPIFVRACMN